MYSLKSLLLLLSFGIASTGFAQLGKIHGIVTEKSTKIEGATVSLLKDNKATEKGLITKADGKYEFSLLPPGDYSIKVTFGEKSYELSAKVAPGDFELLNFDLAALEADKEGGSIGVIDIFGSKEIFDRNPGTFITISRVEIEQGGHPRGIRDIAALNPGITQKDHGSPLNFRGSREGSSAVYVDNVKLRGSDEIPLAAIEQMTVMSGGIPAEFGDVTGGIIVITTGNPGMNGFVGNGMSPKEWKIEKARLRELKRKKGSSGCDCEGIHDLAMAF